VDDFDRAFKRIRRIAKEKNWPGVEEGQSWGTPSLKIKGKMLFRIREPKVGVLMCRLEAKEMLLQVAPHIYFDLPHYKGYPAVLIHLDQIEDDEIAEMIEEYWRKIAPKKMLDEYDARQTAPRPKDKAKARARAKEIRAPEDKAKAKAGAKEIRTPEDKAKAKAIKVPAKKRKAVKR